MMQVKVTQVKVTSSEDRKIGWQHVRQCSFKESLARPLDSHGVKAARGISHNRLALESVLFSHSLGTACGKEDFDSVAGFQSTAAGLSVIYMPCSPLEILEVIFMAAIRVLLCIQGWKSCLH